MLADGQRDVRVARIKVDSVFFGNVSAALSADGTTAAFRLSGNRQGGSSLYSVNVKSGKYAQISQSANSGEGLGSYVWSPAGNTLAFTRLSPAPDPSKVDEAYGTIYIYSVGFQAVKLAGSHGNDRIVGFSNDGLGVYVARQEETRQGTLQHLVYLPLSGGEGRVIYRSQLSLRFSQYTVYAPRPGLTRIAFLAEGDFTQAGRGAAPVPSGIPTTAMFASGQEAFSPASRVPVTGALSGPRNYGLAVAYGEGDVPVLVGRDAEAFPFLAWSGDGESILMGGTRSGASWVVGLDGSRRGSSVSLRGLGLASWSLDSRYAVLADIPTTRLVTVNVGTGALAATRYVGANPKPSAAAIKLPVPYIHQVKDTADSGDGNWACGPTSLAMALAYFKRIEPWSVGVAGDRLVAPTSATSVPDAEGGAPAVTPTVTPTPHTITGADYAPYITSKYTAFGHTYGALARDPRGNLLAGLYGTICPTGLADWSEMSQVLAWHNLGSQSVPATWDGIVGALKRGHPVLLGNELTSEGHIILVIGYTPDGNLLVNDPYGNRFAPGYGGNDGNGVLYAWKAVTPRHALEIVGTVPPPTATPTRTFTPTLTATLTSTSIPTDTATPTPVLEATVSPTLPEAAPDSTVTP